MLRIRLRCKEENHPLTIAVENLGTVVVDHRKTLDHGAIDSQAQCLSTPWAMLCKEVLDTFLHIQVNLTLSGTNCTSGRNPCILPQVLVDAKVDLHDSGGSGPMSSGDCYLCTGRHRTGLNTNVCETSHSVTKQERKQKKCIAVSNSAHPSCPSKWFKTTRKETLPPTLKACQCT